MSVRDELLKEISKQRETNSKKKKFEGNFLDYVDLVKKNPQTVKTAHKRLHEAINDHGMEKMPDPDPRKKCFGGKVIIYFRDGSILEEEKGVADAHPNGLRPFKRSNYIEKFKTLTDGLITKKESLKFLKLVQNLKSLKNKDLINLNCGIKSKKFSKNKKNFIF